MTIALNMRGLLRSPAFWLLLALTIVVLFGADPAHAG